MVHNAEERDELAFGRPTRSGIVEALQLAQHGTPQIAEPLEEQLLLVLAARRDPDVIVGHSVTVSPKIAGCLAHRVSGKAESGAFCHPARPVPPWRLASERHPHLHVSHDYSGWERSALVGCLSPTVIGMSSTVPVKDARAAFDASVTSFSGAVASLPEWDLLASSRCHGWTRLDLTAHVVAGWQEMLGGFVSLVDEDPTVDAASYWTAFADAASGSDRVEVVMAQRRRAAAYTRPSALVGQLRDVAGAVLSGSRTMGGRACRWQGQVFAPGDFLAIWAVENVVHHLDLLVDDPPPRGGLALARATIEALAAGPLPADWPDEKAVLMGTAACPFRITLEWSGLDCRCWANRSRRGVPSLGEEPLLPGAWMGA